MNTDWKSKSEAGATHSITIDLGREHIVHSLQVASSIQFRGAAGPRNHKVEVGQTPEKLHVVAYGAWSEEGGGNYLLQTHIPCTGC